MEHSGDDDRDKQQKVFDSLSELLGDEPRTVSEVHGLLGESMSLSRRETETLMNAAAFSSPSIEVKKAGTGRTSPKIFWMNPEKKEEAEREERDE